MTKKQISARLHDFFAAQPSKTLSFKEIFRALKLDTHPLKMLAIDTMEEMAWDDFLTKVTDTSYRLNTKGQVQRTRFCLTMAVRPSSFRNAIPCGQRTETG